MKRYWIGLGIFTSALVMGSSPVSAHEGHDHRRKQIPGLASGETAGPRAATDAKVTIKLFQYQPGRMQVKLGTTVTWVNEDEIFHTVTVDNKAGGFDAPLDDKGKSFSFTFNQPGTYSYHCDRHEHMRGEIEVR